MRAAKFAKNINLASAVKFTPIVAASFSSVAGGNSLYKIFNDQSKAQGERDFIRFDNRADRWTYKEVKKHSLAFARGLTELGFKSGDKLFVWITAAESQEFVAAQIGAARIGVTLVTHNSNSGEEIKNILKSSKATGILLAPFHKVDDQITRVQLLYSLAPSLEDMQSGDALNISEFPDLKIIIQTSNTTIRGATKFKHVMNYAKKANFGFEMETGTDSSTIIEHYEGGKPTKFNTKDLEAHAKQIWADEKMGSEENVLVVSPLSTPFAVSSGLLGSALNDGIVTCPGVNDPNRGYELLGDQQISTLICDKDFAESAAPKNVITDTVKRALVLGNSGDSLKANSVVSGLSSSAFYDSVAHKKL